MSKVSISFGGGLWLIIQVALLVAYYGGFAPSLPWWVVWFPVLLVMCFVCIVMFCAVGILAALVLVRD